MTSNIFFKKKNIEASKIFPNNNIPKKYKFRDIKPLFLANKDDLTFFDSMNYKSYAQKTKATVCITNKNLEKYLPEKTIKIVVKNVLLELARVLKIIYPFADIDWPDLTLNKPKKRVLSK